MNRKEELNKIMGSQTNDKAVHAQALWNFLAEADSREEKIELLEHVIINLSKVDKHPLMLSNKGLEPGRWSELSKKLGNIVKDHVRNAFFSTNNSKDFAAELYKLYEFLSEPDEVTFALGTTLYSCAVIPYHSLPGDLFDFADDEFKQLILANKEKSELINYLVRLPFYSWTQAVSQVIQVIDDVDDQKLRVALLTLYMIAKKEQWNEE